jgi:hypothetical protein
MILDKDNKAIVDELKLSDDDIEMALSKVDDIINTSNIASISARKHANNRTRPSLKLTDEGRHATFLKSD